MIASPRGKTLSLAFALSALLGSPLGAQVDFIRGDGNGNAAVDIADAVAGLEYLFGGMPAACLDALDANDDGSVNIGDPIYTLAYLFTGGPAPAAPFPACGADPSADGLGCIGPVPGCPASAPPTAFRISSLEIRDPHVFTTFILCVDSTGTVNSLIADALSQDADVDGALDQSFLLVFRPLDQGGAGGTVDFLGNAACTAPAAGTSCDVGPGTVTVGLTYTHPGGTCLAPIPGTTTGSFSPPITNPTSPCFVTDPTSLTLDFAGILVPLESAQLGGTYAGSPATSLVNGMGMGFISEATANATILPAALPIVGGLPLSAILPGGAGNCSSIDATDTGPNGVTSGWWIYFNYTAVQVPYTGP